MSVQEPGYIEEPSESERKVAADQLAQRLAQPVEGKPGLTPAVIAAIVAGGILVVAFVAFFLTR